MGYFDGFLVRVGDDDGAAAMEHARPTVLPEGFLPKVVERFPQGGIVQDVAQFRWEEAALLFSPTSSFQNDTVSVPLSHPLEEALSDHLLVMTSFGQSTSDPSGAADVSNGAHANGTQQYAIDEPHNNITGLPIVDTEDFEPPGISPGASLAANHASNGTVANGTAQTVGYESDGRFALGKQGRRHSGLPNSSGGAIIRPYATLLLATFALCAATSGWFRRGRRHGVH